MTDETVIKMAPELKARWIAALRSGQFKQCDGQLREDLDDGSCAYCCLGVLGEVAALSYTPENGYLNQKDADDIGLPHEMQDILASLNDGCLNSKEREIVGNLFRPDLDEHRHSFARIADFIEERL